MDHIVDKNIYIVIYVGPWWAFNSYTAPTHIHQ